MSAELFADALRKAIDQSLSVMELLSVADRLAKTEERQFIVTLYKTWIERNPGSPLLYAIYFNYGVVLSGQNDFAGAKDALKEAIRLNPDFYPPYINLGIVYERMGAGGEAVLTWYELINRLPTLNGDAIAHKLAALKQAARVLESGGVDANAEEALRLSLEIDKEQRDVAQHWISLRQRQCKWPLIAPWAGFTRSQLLKGISPLSLAAYTDDPMLQLANAARYAKYDVGRPAVSFARSHPARLAGRSPGDRLRIGYLSSDFREHAVGHLTAEVLGLHDRAKVEVFAYYCFQAASGNDVAHQRFKATTDHWVDIHGMTDEQAAERIFADRIDILVDLNGYTNGARTKVLAMRPAPIIVNWLGYPGTTGSPFHNYIIADNFIIPPSHEIFYSENVMRLPCYQPNNRGRVVSKQVMSRHEAGLPENAMVYCTFNGQQKITPFTWRRWMSILHQVPGSVLWMLSSIEDTNNRLVEHAAHYGIGRERLIFSNRMNNADHLARYPLADLFLDGSPYGAHTTASDAMWMGVPILALAGRSFASRVCGSLALAAGVSELICTTSEEYVSLAVELASSRERLAGYRRRLRENRDTCVLFDTPLLVASLEGLYRQMWGELLSGRLPRPDLTNLDIYHEIGSDLDSDDVEMLTVGNYEELYRRELAVRDEYCMMRHDGRFWTRDAGI